MDGQKLRVGASGGTWGNLVVSAGGGKTKSFVVVSAGGGETKSFVVSAGGGETRGKSQDHGETRNRFLRVSMPSPRNPHTRPAAAVERTNGVPVPSALGPRLPHMTPAAETPARIGPWDTCGEAVGGKDSSV